MPDADSFRHVPWQTWVVVIMLGLEGIGDLFTIPTTLIAASWLLAKCLFIVGLLKRWRGFLRFFARFGKTSKLQQVIYVPMS